MGIKFESGDLVTFHGTVKGKRRIAIKGRVLDDGETGIARTVRVMLKPGVAKINGKSIYIIEKKK